MGAESAPPAAPEPPAPAAEPPPPAAPQWRGSPAPDVAETMVPGVAETMVPDIAATMSAEAAAMARESTTLMPAWQPPPAAPEPPAMDAQTEPMMGAAASNGRQAELTIDTGPDAGHSHRVGDQALRLGRSPDNDVILRDPATSGHHARLERRGDQFWIVDLGSTNGTLVNGEPVQEKELTHGDRVTVGQNAVHFSVIGS